MNNSSHPDVPKPQCMKDTMLNGPGIYGMHPVKVASNAECANLCGLKSTCEGWVYNRYRNCYLKRQPIGRFAADDPLHGSVSCQVLQRPLCTLRNLRAAMPVGSRALRTDIHSQTKRARERPVQSQRTSAVPCASADVGTRLLSL